LSIDTGCVSTGSLISYNHGRSYPCFVLCSFGGIGSGRLIDVLEDLNWCR